MKTYPADSEFRYVPKFADNLKPGDVVALDRDGTSKMEVISEPVLNRNPFTRQHHVTIKLREVAVNVDWELIFAASATVFTRRFYHSPSHPEMDAEL